MAHYDFVWACHDEMSCLLATEIDDLKIETKNAPIAKSWAITKAKFRWPSLTFDENSPNTKVGPAFTNVLKSHEFCQNFTNPTWQELKAELFEK
jgi:hypothetical protein